MYLSMCHFILCDHYHILKYYNFVKFQYDINKVNNKCKIRKMNTFRNAGTAPFIAKILDKMLKISTVLPFTYQIDGLTVSVHFTNYEISLLEFQQQERFF